MGDLTVGRIEQLTHTPGPWKWFNYPDGRKLLAGPPKAVIHCPDAPMTCDQPDQYLIATAPDGLALARLVVEYFGEDDIDPRYDGDIKLRDMALALIAKAEGR